MAESIRTALIPLPFGRGLPADKVKPSYLTEEFTDPETEYISITVEFA